MRTIVFFDGVCGLCDRFVSFLIKHDCSRHLHFATLQGATFKAMQGKHSNLGSLDSVLLFDEKNQKFYTESEAALRAMAALGGLYLGLKVFLIVPSFLRNFVYQTIAKNRYKIFGKKESCRLPTPEERAYFLD